MTSLFKYNNSGRRCSRCQSDKGEIKGNVKEISENEFIGEIIGFCHNCEYEEILDTYPATPVRPNPPNGFKFPDEIDFNITDLENSPLNIALKRTKPMNKRNDDRDFLGAIIFPPNIQEQ